MSISEPELEKVLQKTVLLYNHLKSPEVFTKIILKTPELVVLSFSGTFCFSCGILNYIEDFIRDFKALTSKAELKQVKLKELDSHTFQVFFQVKEK